MFPPLYVTETGEARSGIAEQVNDFETGLMQQDIISVRLLAATFVTANKLIGKYPSHRDQYSLLELNDGFNMEEGLLVDVEGYPHKAGQM